MWPRIFVLTLWLVLPPLQAEQISESRAFAQLGEPKYSAGFTHFDYVRPDAPKKGAITLAAVGTFDNFNRYASRGNPAAGSEMLYDSLFAPSEDEPGSYYPLIALSARYANDFSWMEVTLNPRARFHDGTPIHARDVAFSFNKFMTEGVPQFRVAFRGVSVKALSAEKVRIDMAKPDKDLVLSWLSLPVLSEAFWHDRVFSEPVTTPPLSSGPYRITAWKMGQYIRYSRVRDYWAADLPVNKGRFNFDTLRYDYYLDDNVAFEAFKAGAYDRRAEGSAKKWATQYRGSNFDRGYIVRDIQPNTAATDTTWMAFNNEKPLFQDVRIREAISLALDFEWMNRALFYQAYKRTSSYFQNTEYAAQGKPDEAQLAVLMPWRSSLPAELFTRAFHPPHSDGSGYDRSSLLKASDLLAQAGWTVRNQRLVNARTGRLFRFELLLRGGTTSEWVMPFQHNLARLGIQMTIRQVDSSQYLRRVREGDYDMVPTNYQAMPFPSSSLQTSWQSDYINSSWNTARLKNPLVDELVKAIVQHQSDEKMLLTLGPALDRVLLWNYYMIPLWYAGQDRVAYWNKFSMPSVKPAYSSGLFSWWYDADKASHLPAGRR